MGPVLPSIGTVFLIMFLVPFPFYVAFEAMGMAEMPQEGSPALFVLSVIVTKLGVATGFVLLLRRTLSAGEGGIWGYAAVWWLMYAVVEIGQAIVPGYGWGEAMAGILAEAVYFPLSAWAAARLLKGPGSGSGPGKGRVEDGGLPVR